MYYVHRLPIKTNLPHQWACLRYFGLDQSVNIIVFVYYRNKIRNIIM